MFESIQDYMMEIIDRNKLVDNMANCEEYLEASPDIRNKLDLFIEDIKEAKTEEDVKTLLNSNALYDMGVQPDAFKLLDLATRKNGGYIPIIDPAVLAAFIDLCIENNDDERLFRLAYNYNNLIFDKSTIEDYYISHNNIFYLNEMACNDLIGIHYDKIIEELLKAEQLDELKYFASNISDKTIDISKVIKRIKELN